MSLRRRLTLSLLAILVIFALNVGTHFWGSFARTESMSAYRNSVAAQQLAASIGLQLDEQRKQIRVLAALRETTEETLSEEDRQQAEINIQAIVNDIRELGTTTHEVTRPQYDELWNTSRELLPAWLEFYANYNRAGYQSPHGAPDAPEIYETMRSRLVALENRQAYIAEQRAAIIDRTIALTDRISVISFLASILLTSILGFFLIRYTNTSFKRLKTGTLRIGSGDLNYRIDNIDDTGELGDLANAFNDMSDKLLNAIEEVRRAKDDADHANQAKSHFLANVSHELRTPLNAIIGYSEMLHDELGDEGQVNREQFRTDLDRIILSGRQLLALINDILDLSKIETGKMTVHFEEFDPREALQEVCKTIEPLLGARNNTLRIDTGSKLPVFCSDATKFRQIFLNLLSNACKFTESGTIDLSATAGDNGEVRFRVTDNGIGMSKAQQERIFEAFVQADASTSSNYGGTGLGLAICREYCELMGGAITLESQEGVGTTFEVSLPSRALDPASSPAAA
jgi:signal transduction histidine kinase